MAAACPCSPQGSAQLTPPHIRQGTQVPPHPTCWEPHAGPCQEQGFQNGATTGRRYKGVLAKAGHLLLDLTRAEEAGHTPHLEEGLAPGTRNRVALWVRPIAEGS